MERERGRAIDPPASTPLGVRALGHVAFFVRDLEAARRFYHGVLGLAETGTGKNGRIVFFAVRRDDRPGSGRSSEEPAAATRHPHDVACELSSSQPSSAERSRVARTLRRVDGPGPRPHRVPGFYHVAFDVGRSLEDLGAARRSVVSHGLEPFGETATSFCVRDPDGHMIELYVELEADPR